MLVKIKPVIVMGKGDCWICRPDGLMEVIPPGDKLESRVARLVRDLKAKLQSRSSLLPESIVRSESELASVRRESIDADALLVYALDRCPFTRYSSGASR